MRRKIIQGFDFTQSQTVNANTVAIMSILKVPDRAFLCITHFGNYVSDIGAWGYIQWDLLQNRGLDPSFNAIKDQLGVANLLRDLGFKPIYAPATLLEMQITNSHPSVNYGVGVSFKGYFYINV